MAKDGLSYEFVFKRVPYFHNSDTLTADVKPTSTATGQGRQAPRRPGAAVDDRLTR